MMTRSKQRSALRAWGTQLAAKRGHKHAVAAVARKLAVVMHRMWIDGTTFRVSAADPGRRGCALAERGLRAEFNRTPSFIRVIDAAHASALTSLRAMRPTCTADAPRL